MRHIKDSLVGVREQKTLALPIGMKYLDINLGGVYPGEMTVVCGGTDDGKTALMIRQIHCLAFEKEIPVMIVLNGTSERTFLACMAAFYCNIITNDIHQVYSDTVCKDDVEAYWRMLGEKPVYFADSNELSEKGLDAFKQAVSANGIQAIFFEHASWMHVLGWERDRLGFHLKQLAKELHVAVIAEYDYMCFEDEDLVHLFERDCFSNFADNIIGIKDYDHHGIIVDEKGNDVCGKVKVRIMKHKGFASYSSRDIIFRNILLYCRSKERATHIEASETTDGFPTIKDLMDKLDCVIDNPLDRP